MRLEFVLFVFLLFILCLAILSLVFVDERRQIVGVIIDALARAKARRLESRHARQAELDAIETDVPASAPAKVAANPDRAVTTALPPRLVACPYCSEEILPGAKKCKHCGEYLDATLRSRMAQPAPQVVIHNTNKVSARASVVSHRGGRRWSRLVAGILSLLFPGLGQLYKGQLFSGIFWFIIVAVGYIALIVPGLILHSICILGAMMGDPYR